MSVMYGNVARRASDRSALSAEISDRSSEISDAMHLVKLAAGPRVGGESVKLAIGRAARSLKWSFTRTRDIWYGNARRLDAHEMDKLRSLERKHLDALAEPDLRKHVAQIAALRARLNALDPDFHRNDIAALDYLLSAKGEL